MNANKFSNLRSDSVGSALLYALMGITLLSVLLASVYSLTGQRMNESLRAQMTAQSRYTAEAGMEHAIRKLLDQPRQEEQLRQAINVNNGIWIPQSSIPLGYSGYEASYQVKVAFNPDAAVPSSYIFTSIGRTLAETEVRSEVVKQIDFRYRPFEYISSPLFDLSLFSQGSLETYGRFSWRGGKGWITGSFQPRGKYTVEQVTICEGNNPQGVGCSNPIDPLAEMEAIYQALTEAAATRTDIFISPQNVVIEADDMVNGMWTFNNRAYRAIVAPNITIKGNRLTLGTAETPILLFAVKKEGQSITPGSLTMQNVTVNGFVIGQSLSSGKRVLNNLQLNGGMIVLDSIRLTGTSSITFPYTSGMFTEAYQ